MVFIVKFAIQNYDKYPMQIKKTTKLGANDHLVYVIESEKNLKAKDFSKDELSWHISKRV